MRLQKTRLLNVAKALLESPEAASFTMGCYVRVNGGRNHCGTPACALGHYAARKDLQTKFRLRYWLERLPGSAKKRRIMRDGVFAASTLGLVHYDSATIRNHFGITADQAEELFGAQGCGRALDPEGAANYIKHFIERNAGQRVDVKRDLILLPL